ncbi:MAG: hypothetical protein R3E12_16615 [Candidatus Eisenbacteria bacterium]
MPRTAGSLGIAVALTVLMAGSVGVFVGAGNPRWLITAHVHENHEGGAHHGPGPGLGGPGGDPAGSGLALPSHRR